jgi:hypothetical protein
VPKRLVDGEALWRSDKLARVQPLEFRAEYANLIPLAGADGTFEANSRRVWTEVYSYNRPEITVDLVEEMLDEFERVGMIGRRKDEDGKIWGKFIGIEARLPAESQQSKYKPGKAHLFSDLQKSTVNLDNIQTTSTEGLADIYIGLDRIGKERIGAEPQPSVATNPKFQAGLYPDKNPKKLHKFIVQIWQQVKGISAVARYPSRYPQKWEELCENHPGDLIVPAFELWAQEEGAYSNTEYPVAEFLRVAAKYMDRVLPTKKLEKPVIDWSADDERARKENEEFLAAEKERETFAAATRGQF